jgi:hypothetical protein
MAVYQIYDARTTLLPQRRILKLCVVKLSPKYVTYLYETRWDFKRELPKANFIRNTSYRTSNPHGYPTENDHIEPCQLWPN